MGRERERGREKSRGGECERRNNTVVQSVGATVAQATGVLG